MTMMIMKNLMKYIMIMGIWIIINYEKGDYELEYEKRNNKEINKEINTEVNNIENIEEMKIINEKNLKEQVRDPPVPKQKESIVTPPEPMLSPKRQTEAK